MLLFERTIDKDEKKWIRDAFKDLIHSNGYYAVLQYLYNNSQHFTTVGEDKNICTPDLIQSLHTMAHSKTQNIRVKGSVHTNYHVSGVLFDSMTFQPLFIRDTYIRFSIDGTPGYRHLLLTPPNISDLTKINQYVYQNQSQLCFQSGFYISPTFAKE
jgi:hypothetical protein